MSEFPDAGDPTGAFTRPDGTTEGHDIDHGRVIRIWENVQSWGATGGGLIDDTAAIQAAINAASGPVYFPPGVYLTSSQLNAREGISLLGAGKDSTIIRCMAAHTERILLIQNEGNLEISGLTFDLNKDETADGGANTQQMAIYMNATTATGVTEVVIRDCKVMDGHQVGIRGVAGSYGLPLRFTVEDCEVTNVEGIGIQASRAASLLVKDCWVHGNGDVGIQTAGGVGDRIIGNLCDGNIREGIALTQIGSDPSAGSVVMGNVCQNNGEDTPSNVGWGIVASVKAREFTIVGNLCRDNFNGGISIDVTDTSTVYEDTHGTVAGNTCVGHQGTNASHGIYVNNAVGVAVTGNTCVDNQLAGIAVEARGCTVVGNVCRDNGTYGIRFDGSSASTPDAGDHVVGLNKCEDDALGDIFEAAGVATTISYLTYQTGTPTA